MSETVQGLSDALADAAARAGASVLRVQGGRRFGASGIAWSADGLAIASAHGLPEERDVEVGLPDGTEATAEVLGRDASSDVALLHIEGAALQPAAWLEGEPRLGALVLALARPGGTLRAGLGIVAGLATPREGAARARGERLLLTDLRGGPGQAGSLLVDVQGRALGMNTAGGWRGHPTAIGVAALRRVVAALQAHGRVQRGYLGIGAYPVELPTQLEQAAAQAQGLVVLGVEPDGPCDKAGMFTGDILLSLDGTAVGHLGDLQAWLGEERVGRKVSARILRGGAAHELAVTVTARP
jgi:serine protease DegQ